MSESLRPRELQHTRLPCPLLSPGVCSDSCPLSQWCSITISSSAAPFSFFLQSFPVIIVFSNHIFSSGGPSSRASASVLPVNTQGWFPLGLTGLIFLQSKGPSIIVSDTTVQKHQFFGRRSYVIVINFSKFESLKNYPEKIYSGKTRHLFWTFASETYFIFTRFSFRNHNPK